MKIKVIYGSDIRRWHSSQNNQFENLIQFINNTFNFVNQQTYFLQFEDDEGDRMTLSCEADLQDALEVAEQEKRKSLKVYVVSVDNSQENSTMHNNSSTSSSSTSSSSLDQDELIEKSCEECVNDFFSNESIKSLLPDFIGEIMKRLRNNTNNDNSLEVVLVEVLSLKEFTEINSHQLFTNYIKKHLSCISEKANLLLPVLLAFNDDHIISIIPQLVETASQMLAGTNDVELDITPIFENLFPGWIAMMNANNPNGCNIDLGHIFGTENATESVKTMMSGWCNNEEQKEVETCHNNIICDMCNANPIRGIRYKCAVCPNFDMCSKCESTGTHNKNHALLKFRVPYTGFERGKMWGIKELFWRRHCRRGFKWGRRFNNNCDQDQDNQHNYQKKFQQQVNKLKKQQEKINQQIQKLTQNSSFNDMNCEKVDLPMCPCGSKMEKLNASHAYNSVLQVICDNCEKIMYGNTEIYHCQQQRNHVHPEGYDLCAECAFNQVKEKKDLNLQIEQQQLVTSDEHEFSTCQVIEQQVSTISTLPKVEIEQEQPPTEEVNTILENQVENFPYQEQLNNLIQMGFNKEISKLELMNHDGNIEQTIQVLLDL